MWSCSDPFVERAVNVLYGPPLDRAPGRPGVDQLVAAEAGLSAMRMFFLNAPERPNRIY